MPISSTLRHWSQSLLDVVLPPRCPVTGTLVSENFTVAPEYWAQLRFIHKPFCQSCGNPFAHDLASDLTCALCMRDPPPFTRARAALAYDDASAAMILRFKYADKIQLARVFSTWLMHNGAELCADADYLIPVPLHRWRLMKRRYNQATALALALSSKTNIPVAHFTLQRRRATSSQGRKTHAQRHDNLRNAFAVPNPEQVKGKHLILIDDVFTSGATVKTCAKELLKSGAKQVDVLTVARVVYND